MTSYHWVSAPTLNIFLKMNGVTVEVYMGTNCSQYSRLGRRRFALEADSRVRLSLGPRRDLQWVSLGAPGPEFLGLGQQWAFLMLSRGTEGSWNTLEPVLEERSPAAAVTEGQTQRCPTSWTGFQGLLLVSATSVQRSWMISKRVKDESSMMPEIKLKLRIYLD